MPRCKSDEATQESTHERLKPALLQRIKDLASWGMQFWWATFLWLLCAFWHIARICFARCWLARLFPFSCAFISLWCCMWSIKQSTDGINQSNTSKQSSNQQMHQSIKQSSNQQMHQSIKQSTDGTSNQQMHQSTDVTSNQQMEQAINQSSNQAINRWNQSIKHIQTIKWSVLHTL